MTIIRAAVTYRLDAAGEWEAELPLSDPQAQALSLGDVFQIVREGEGLVGAGIIERIERQPPDRLRVSGLTLLGELLRTNTGRFRRYDSESVDAIVDDLLSATSWQRQGSVPDLRTTWYHGASLLEAVEHAVVKLSGRHFRERLEIDPATLQLVRRLEIGSFGQTARTVLSGPPDVSILDAPELLWAEDVAVTEDRTDVWNWLIVLGAGDGESQLTTEWQTYLPNMLQNWSFEQGSQGWMAYGGVTATPVTTRYVHGSQSLRLQGGATAGGVRQQVAAAAGKTYRAKAWAWVGAGTVTLRLSFLDGAGGVLSSASATGSNVNRWNELQVTAQAPTGTASARVEVEVSASGDVWADAVRLWETAASKGLPLEVDYRPSRLTTDTPHLNWALVDETSVTAYGRRERAVAFKEVAPLSQTAAALQVAANSLYDLAAVQMRRWRSPTTTYRVRVRGKSPPLPGDKVRLRYRGYAKALRGDYTFLDVDAELWVLEVRRELHEDGTDSIELTVSTSELAQGQDDADVVARIADLTKTFAVSVQAGVSNWTVTHALQTPLGPGTGQELVFKLRVPVNCMRLLSVKMVLTPRAIRATATGAATSVPHTHSVSGDFESSTVPAKGYSTASPNAQVEHAHPVGTIGGSIGWADPPYARGMLLNLTGGGTVNVQVGSSENVGSQDFRTAVGGLHEHSFTIDAHSHTVSISVGTSQGGSHNHPLVYGIFEGTQAQNLRLSIDGVDRTSELGGPWSSEVELDITRYLLDENGLPVRGQHEVRVYTSQLGAVDVISEWVAVVAPIKAA